MPSDAFPPIDQQAEARRGERLGEQAAELIRSRCDVVPTWAIILGSGLGGLADAIDRPTMIRYEDIPGFSQSTVGGHGGQLILGYLDDASIVAMAGRFHRYEGWSNDEVTFPVRVMQRLGAERLIVSNAAGGVSPKLCIGDIVIIRDHINLMGGRWTYSQAAWQYSPLRHREIYDTRMSLIALRVGVQHGFTAVQGTYLATLGPTYETRSEYRMMRRIGADVVGMSTVPEVLAATSIGMKVLGLSVVTNVANPDRAIKADHCEVLESGRLAAVKMGLIVRAVLNEE